MSPEELEEAYERHGDLGPGDVILVFESPGDIIVNQVDNNGTVLATRRAATGSGVVSRKLNFEQRHTWKITLWTEPTQLPFKLYGMA